MNFRDKNRSLNKIESKAEPEGTGFKGHRVPLPHELTAEWTVKAHLKFAKAGETLKKEFSSDDTVQPVRIIYKWSTLDTNDKNCEFNYENDKVRGNCSRSSSHLHNPTKDKSCSNLPKEGNHPLPTNLVVCKDMVGVDSAFCSSDNKSKRQQGNFKTEDKDSIANFYGTRCESTCHITVTAVADFLPPSEDTVLSEEAPVHTPSKGYETYAFNTTSNYIPQFQNKEAHTTDSSNNKPLNLRDAICQTSDTETTFFSDVDRKCSTLGRRDSRRLHRKLKTDDAFKQMEYRDCTDGGNNLKASYTEPQNPEMLEENMRPTGKRSQISTEPQKKPRTVHIDVYCTGSEDDDQADVESSSDDNNKKGDQESNSTFQTVLENDRMRLSHHRITGASLPRRLVERENTCMSESIKDLNIGHALTKSSTAEEVNESKQLLFRKHLGDQRAAKLQNIRQKYLRQLSDETLSLGYPNSSRSTIRDNTHSSISSAVVESLWKETDDTENPSCSLAKSDSFEYENALDRLRIRQMEHLWSRNYLNDEELKSQNYSRIQSANNNLQTISELTSLKPNISCSPELTEDTLSEINEKFYEPPQSPNCQLQSILHFPRNSRGFLQFFGPSSEVQGAEQIKKENISLPQPDLHSDLYKESLCLHLNYKTYLQRWKSETRDDLSFSETPVLPSTETSRQQSPQIHVERSASEVPLSSTDNNTFTTNTPSFAKRFDMHQRRTPIEIDASSQVLPFGYSSEYLDKAKMFGKVVVARKPGHHVGPTKNPNCSCECCQRWLNERFQTRGRLFSLGEMPVLKRPS